MGISIVIRCFNEERHIGKLLSGIMQQTVQDIEIILVDSGSTDATLSIASHFPVKVVSIAPQDFSFGRSLNLGCQAATQDLIAIASAHVYPVYQDWLARLTAPFKNPQVALVYGKQRGDERTQYSEHQVFAKWFPDASNSHQNHPFCNNANAAIRRSLWAQIPYDETLTGLEDLDWAKRIMQLNYQIAYVAEAEIIHVHEETPQQTYNRYRREAIALHQIFPQERFKLWDFIRLFSANTLNDYCYAWRDRVFHRHLIAIPRFRWMQFWGTYQGFIQQGPISSQLQKTFYYPRSQNRLDWSPDQSIKRQRINYEQADENACFDAQSPELKSAEQELYPSPQGSIAP